MAKITIPNIGADYASAESLNSNFDAIEAAIENTISRDGTAPNNMSAALDIGSNKIVNVASPTSNTDAANKLYVDTNTPLSGTTADSVYASTTTMKAESLIAGSFVQTKGYYASGDGGEATYLIVAPQAFDGYGDHELANGNIAVVQTFGKASGKLYGAKYDGATDDILSITAGLAVNKALVISSDSLITTSIVIGDDQELVFENNAKLLAGANNITMISAPTTAYGAKIIRPYLDVNSKTGVTAMDLNNFRQFGAKITQPSLDGQFASGIKMTGCFAMTIDTPTTWQCPVGLEFMTNSGDVTVLTPMFDNTTGFGGTGVGTAIKIHPTGPINTGITIVGGICQGFDIGLDDEGFGTQVKGTYFEQCTTADINSNGAEGYVYSGTQHWAAVGAVAHKGRNCDSGTIISPFIGSGARTDKLFDYDATNTNCYYLLAGSASTKNGVGAKAIGIGTIAKEYSTTFTPILYGSSTGVGVPLTLSASTGYIRKIGQRVFVDFSATVSNLSTATGNLTFEGIPFAAPLGTPTTTLEAINILLRGTPFVTGNEYSLQFTGTNTVMQMVTVPPATGTAALVAVGTNPVAVGMVIKVSFSYDIAIN